MKLSLKLKNSLFQNNFFIDHQCCTSSW